VGQAITFTYRVRNVGRGPARGVEVRAAVPIGATLVSVTVVRTTEARRRLAARLDPGCTSTGFQVTCFLGTVAPGTGATVTMIVTPTASGPLFSAGSAVSAEVTTAPSGGSAEIVDSSSPTGTASSSAPAPEPPAPGPTLPPPAGGVSANVIPVAGTVLVNGLPLREGEQLPLGVPIDTTNGIAQVITIGEDGQVQAAFFFGGVFTLRQAAPTAVTDVVLQGGDTGVCAAKKTKRTLSAKAPKAKRSKKVIRSLWGQGTGSFRTRGRYSSATVRGTFWLTADRCDGTLTRVEDGSVTVTDFPKKKTIVVTAGHSYLAAAP
jgi:uncharacterized repeat protein (TIGR01451 family)